MNYSYTPELQEKSDETRSNQISNHKSKLQTFTRNQEAPNHETSSAIVNHRDSESRAID